MDTEYDARVPTLSGNRDIAALDGIRQARLSRGRCHARPNLRKLRDAQGFQQHRITGQTVSDFWI